MPPVRANGDIALDSARQKDADGRLHILKSHISKATVNPYYGREIPHWEVLGLDPDHVYQLLRHPDELAKGAATFARLPILGKHVPVDADDIQREHIIGAIGSDVIFNDPYLDADLCFWDAEAIAGIETNTVRELSCAYRYVPVMTPGEYQGQRYDGIMTEIVGNHLALVEAGRAGSDVLAADEDITMKMTKLGKALFLTLGGMSPKLAQDSALPGLVGQASKKTPIKADELVPKLVAMDSELDAEKAKKTIAAVIALDAEKEEKPAEDEDDEDDDPDAAEDGHECTGKDCAMCKDKKARDKKARDEEAESRTEKAMDAFKKELRDADEARRIVRPVVGDVIAQDTAEGIYGFALDHMKVAHEGVTGVPALKALFELANSRSTPAPSPVVAMDSDALVAAFPGVARFGKA